MRNSRRVLTVLCALVVAASIGFAVEFVFRVVTERLHPDGTTLAAHFSWMIRQWFYMFPALMTCLVVTKLARFRAPAFLIAMICVQGLLIVRSQAFAPSTPVPTSLWVLTLIATPLPIILVGWLQIQPPTKSDTATRALPASPKPVG